MESQPQAVVDDGLVCPEVGPWSEDKYRLISYYASLFATGMKRKCTLTSTQGPDFHVFAKQVELSLVPHFWRLRSTTRSINTYSVRKTRKSLPRLGTGHLELPLTLMLLSYREIVTVMSRKYWPKFPEAPPRILS